MAGAVIYTRVSTEDQTKNLSLPTQDRLCREYCERHGLEVIEKFEERGQSAKTADRPELKALLAYCRANKKRISIVVVFNLSRFSRNPSDHWKLRDELKALNINLRSVAEDIDETSEGELKESLFSSFARYDNAKRAERTVIGMNQALTGGRWVFKAPLGYKNIRVDGRAAIVQDPAMAPLILEAFELVASGAHSHKDIIAHLAKKGLLNTKGQPLSAQVFSGLLRRRFYVGMLDVGGKLNSCLKGGHEPLVSEELFQRVKLSLRPERAVLARSRRDNPDFPLRRFVLCGRCGRPLTGSWSTGRSKRYANYHCKQNCKGSSVGRDALESLFVEYLRRAQPSTEFLQAFRLVVRDVWNQKRDLALEGTKATYRKLEQLRDHSRLLLDAHVYKKTIDQATYQTEKVRLDEEIAMTEQELRDQDLDDVDLDGLLAVAEQLIGNVALVWPGMDLDKKQRLQRVLFPAGVPFTAGELGTAEKCYLLTLLAPSQRGTSNLVDLSGVEPLTSSMRMTRSAN
jgi:site-specific DNA recombinase